MKSNRNFWLVMAAILVLVVILVGGAGGDGPPYDPNSVNPDGARGIVEILEDLGADVATRRSAPREDDTAVLMLQDRLTEEDSFALVTWVRDGGVLVVADINSSFANPSLFTPEARFSNRTIDRNFCSIDALQDVNQLEVPLGQLLDPLGWDSCFRDQGVGSFVVATPEGSGTIVSIGGPDVFTNAAIDEADAAVLAVALLAPDPERARVTFMGPSSVPIGDQSINDLVAPRVTNWIFQLLAAFLLYALFRMRRLGGVVAEPVPVLIEGSELVLQSGVLSERAQDPASAAEIIRHDFVTRTHRSLGIPRESAPTPGHPPSDRFVDVVAARTGTSHADIVDTLTSRIATEWDLISSARSIDQLDHALQTPTPDRPSEASQLDKTGTP